MAIKGRFKLLVQECSHRAIQFVMLGGDQGHDMLVIGTIADMIVYKYIRVCKMEDLSKGSRIPGVALDKIPVEVKVLGIAAETEFLGAVLVYPVIDTPVQATPDIVNRDKCEYHVVGYAVFIGNDIPCQ